LGVFSVARQANNADAGRNRQFEYKAINIFPAMTEKIETCLPRRDQAA